MVAEVREWGSLYKGQTSSYQFDGSNKLPHNRRRRVPAEWTQSCIAPRTTEQRSRLIYLRISCHQDDRSPLFRVGLVNIRSVNKKIGNVIDCLNEFKLNVTICLRKTSRPTCSICLLGHTCQNALDFSPLYLRRYIRCLNNNNINNNIQSYGLSLLCVLICFYKAQSP